MTTVSRDAAPHVDGRRVRWEEHKRRRRQAIIDAAIAVIEEHPPGTTIHVQQIAERAGLARPALYRHFTDRADLDRAVQEQAIGQLLAELDPGVILQGTVEQVILRIVETYVTWAGDHPALHRVAVREATGADGGNPLRAAVQQIADLVHQLFSVGAETLGLPSTPTTWTRSTPSSSAWSPRPSGPFVTGWPGPSSPRRRRSWRAAWPTPCGS